MATPENKVAHCSLSAISKKVGTRCRSPSYERFFEGRSSPFMRLARTPHGASRLVQAMSAWLVKIRCAPSRHSRDARVYGHTTTAMHKLSTPPPPPMKHRGNSRRRDIRVDVSKLREQFQFLRVHGEHNFMCHMIFFSTFFFCCGRGGSNSLLIPENVLHGKKKD